MKQKTLLFYAPGVESVWTRTIILPPLHSLAEEGWNIYFYTGGRYGAYDVIQREYLPANPKSKIHFIEAPLDFPVDINQRLYTPTETATLKDFLASQLKGVSPDVIVVRGPTAPYLAALFPGVRILDLMEGHFPYFNFGHEIVFSMGDMIYGFPFYDRHHRSLLKEHRVSASDSRKIDKIRKAVKKKSFHPMIADYVKKLRKRFSKIILFPFDHFQSVIEFSTTKHTVMGNQAENLKLLMKNSPKDWCFLCTFHPHSMRHDIFKPYDPFLENGVNHLRSGFENCENVFFPQLDLCENAITHALVEYTDATAIETGKTFFVTMLLDKPLIRLGAVAADFYKIIDVDENLKTNLEKFTPPPRKKMNHFFHWVITCYKHPAPIASGSYYYIRCMLERAADKAMPDSRLYGWASTELQQDSLDAMVRQVTDAPRRIY